MGIWFSEGLEVIQLACQDILPDLFEKKGLFRHLLAQGGFLAGARDLIVTDPTQALFTMCVIERHRAENSIE